MKQRMIVCAYCSGNGHASKEHVVPKWVYAYTKPHVGVTPARKRNKWGGAATIRDVCSRCNNGILSQLDKSARQVHERALRGRLSLGADERRSLARWAGKVAFNMQRFCFLEGTQGAEPRMPTSAAAWMLGERAAGGVLVGAAWIDHASAIRENYGVFGSNGTILPHRIVQAGPLVLFVAWEHPQLPEAAGVTHAFWCERVPAASLSLSEAACEDIPQLIDPELLLRGFRGQPELARELSSRLG